MEITEEELLEVFEGSDEGKSFVKSLLIAQDIIQNPEKYSGPKAQIVALQLASHRVIIGAIGNYRKSIKSDLGSIDRKRKDLLLSLEKNLEEVINCLKIIGRNDIPKGL